MVPQTLSSLHEAWALASLMRARHGVDALPCAINEAKKSKTANTDCETVSIWQAIIDCLAH